MKTLATRENVLMRGDCCAKVAWQPPRESSKSTRRGENVSGVSCGYGPVPGTQRKASGGPGGGNEPPGRPTRRPADGKGSLPRTKSRFVACTRLKRRGLARAQHRPWLSRDDRRRADRCASNSRLQARSMGAPAVCR